MKLEVYGRRTRVGKKAEYPASPLHRHRHRASIDIPDMSTPPVSSSVLTPKSIPATLGGAAAVLIWASCVSVARLLSESLGVFTSAAMIFTLAGTLACAVQLSRRAARADLFALPKRYFAWCGALFVLNQIGLYGGLGLARSRMQVLEVGAINYLWPALTLLFSIPLLGQRARPWLLTIGVALALAGIVATTMDPSQLSPGDTLARIVSSPVAYVLALMGAIVWAVYSNLARLWAGNARTDAVPLFLLASGLALWGIRAAVHEISVWDVRTTAALVYAALLPAYGAYALWDTGVRKGDFALLSSLSYTIPVLSTLLSCALLGVHPGPTLWTGIAMVSVGAVVCRLAIEPSTSLPHEAR